MTRDYIIPALVAVAVFLVAVFIGTFVARAHTAPSGWSYPLNCCSGIDCAEINAATVQETPQGYVVTLTSADHMMVLDPWTVTYTVPYTDPRIKDSPDGVYHACVSRQTVVNGEPMGGRLICLFVPPKGF